MNRQAGARANLATVGHDECQFTISRLADVEQFARMIGFADERKQRRLDDALSLIHQYGAFQAVNHWIRAYEKQRRTWVRRGALALPLHRDDRPAL